MTFEVFETESGCKFRCTTAQAETLRQLSTIQRGGIGTVHGYVSTSGRTKPETADIQFITAFSLERLYKRKIAALESVTLGQVMESAGNEPKLSSLSLDKLTEIFNTRRTGEIESMQKTLDGVRTDSRRQAHDLVYCTVSQGIKVHYQTFKNADKETELELIGGLPVLKSIMVSFIEINRKVREAGEYKVVNSGAPVLMSKAINRALNTRSTSMKMLSLKEDNFEKLVVSRKEILPEDVKGIPSELFIR